MNLNEQNYNSILHETKDYFQAQGYSIIGEGFKEIATDGALFESYISELTRGTNANDEANIRALMGNTNSLMIKESSITGIQPIASLSMPVIRKLWPKFALKDALKTEVAKSPRFVVSYTKPYLLKSDGSKIYLPKGLNTEEGFSASGKKYIAISTFDVTSGAAVIKQISTTVSSTPSAITTQPLDELIVTSVVYKTASLDDDAFTALTSTNGADYITTTSGTPDTYKVTAANSVYKKGSDEKFEVLAAETAVFLDDNKYYADNTTFEVPVYFRASASEETVKLGKRLSVNGSGIYDILHGAQLIVNFDGANRKATFALVGGEAGDKVTITAKVGVSSEFNEEGVSISFDLLRQDIDIPTGTHINAPLPIEFLNDILALYQIDGTKEVVDLMTNTFAQRLDLEILDFIQNSFLNRPGNEAFDGYGTNSDFALNFNCIPAPGFAGSPKAWREELKPQIDYLAQKIKNETHLTSGLFTIVGNPLDINLISNIDWSFRGGQGGNVDGVDVDYSIGTYVGGNAYKIIASVNVPVGMMYLIFIPNSDKQMTYKYYPYTFSTESGYIDPNRSRVPSIMMTKRHTFQEFLPAIGMIVIANNDGSSQFSPGYAPWSTTSGAAGS